MLITFFPIFHKMTKISKSSIAEAGRCKVFPW